MMRSNFSVPARKCWKAVGDDDQRHRDVEKLAEIVVELARFQAAQIFGFSYADKLIGWLVHNPDLRCGFGIAHGKGHGGATWHGIGGYFWNSAVITVLSLIVVAFFIPAAAYSIARNMSKKKAFAIMYSLLILGIFVPFQVIMIPITVMMSKLGLANMWGLVLLYLTYAIPQTLFLYVGYIKISVPDSLDEAAEIDGADRFTTYRRIIFPMLKPMHATTLIINALWFWNDFMLPLLILNKDSKMWTLPLFQYNYQGQYFNDYGPSFASYIVGILTITVVYLIFQKHIISGMSNGAVK